MTERDETPLQHAVAAALASAPEARDFYDRAYQERTGKKGKPLYDIMRGESRTPKPETLRIIAEAMGLPSDHFISVVYQGSSALSTVVRHEAGGRSDRPEHPRSITTDAGETASVMRLDLSYSMGPGSNLDDSYIEAEAFEFDIGFLRSLTVTPADRIRIVDGIGDSMTPTLHDRDLLFVDINQQDLNAQDRIWAIWLFGLGAVKRLRAIGTDRVLVISDNPDVENQEVQRADIVIHGRVVGSIKRH
ncbi:S24 family peptidase [uncultured Sphingomonas sp.]|uniref:S24 family peptidase n=1 Tax=uncultured Sphingomonas sp. TaxID=158754 RepID=UPI002595C21E|nr:S24 family peptidase [uncultured Sphingomonas sp.]